MKGTKKLEFSELIKKEDKSLDALLIYGKKKSDGKNQLLLWYQKGNEVEKFYRLRSILTDDQAVQIVDWIEEFHPERFESEEVEI